MTYKEWFNDQQGTAYDGMWSFVKAAWDHQQEEIERLREVAKANEATILEYCEENERLQAKWLAEQAEYLRLAADFEEQAAELASLKAALAESQANYAGTMPSSTTQSKL